MRITGGEARGLHLFTPQLPRIRPTSDRVRGALFQILGEIVKNSVVLDLYAGTGALGIEALSRGAARVDFVEHHPSLCQTIERNLSNVGFTSSAQLYRMPVEKALRLLDGAYELALLDPPYNFQKLPGVIMALTRPGLIKKNGVVVIEHTNKTSLECTYETLHISDRRRYGDTALSIYRMGGD